MQLGKWAIRSVIAGRFGLDGGAMFGVVPRTMWSKCLAPDESNRIPMAMRVLVATGEGRTILVDVAAGGGYTEKEREIYAFEDDTSLVQTLERVGVAAGDITDVLLTHLHFDHAAGVAERTDDGWKLLFPGATHHVQKSQWDHALNPNPRDRASYYRDRIEIMRTEGVLEIHDGAWSMCPGFDLHIFHGHTPGQQLPRISDAGEALFFCGDLIPTQHHIPTPYIMAYDLDPVLAMEEKIALLNRAYDEQWVLFFEHDAHLEACRLGRDGKRYSAGDPVPMGT